MLPSAASKAYTRPPKSAVNTTPPAVGVTDARIGRAAEYFHLMVPDSASNAVTQPRAPSGGSNIAADTGPSLPNQGVPAGGISLVSRFSWTREHQSTAPTYSRFVCGLYAAPFHSTPPTKPGQNRTMLSRDSGASTFSRVVVGRSHSTGKVVVRVRSSTDNRPFLLADATMARPPRVVTTMGGLSTSQS